MHEVLVNRLGGLSLPRKSVVRLTDRPDMTLDVYRGRKTTMQQQQNLGFCFCLNIQSNFNGSNTFGTMKISSTQGYFEPMRVDNSARSGGITRISLIFYNMKVCCVFSLESPHRGDSYEYTQYTVFNIKKKITLNYPQSAAKEFFPRDSRTSSKQPW